jgi:hypothetical protein
MLEVGAALAGMVLVLGAVSFDGTDLLTLARVPRGDLNSPWVLADLATWRAVCTVVGGALLVSGVLLWKAPQSVGRVTDRVSSFARAASRSRLTVPLALTVVVLSKTLLQLALYSVGYAAYGADDFSRTFSADYWQYHRTFNLAGDGWVGLSGSTWLPFPDYLFGLALSLKRDLFLTPKIVNLLLSGVAVIAVYWLSCELFGRAAGLLAAVLFAFQPWHIWLGISGMTSDLPSVVLITFFGVYLVRWTRTDGKYSLLAAATLLGIGNGFRYENWFFAILFSAVVAFVAVSRLRQGRGALSNAVAALVIVNAFPVAWMTASYVVLGDWLPALHVTNAFMVGAPMPGASEGQAIAPSMNQSPHMAQISMAVLAFGSFPFELILSMLGIAWLVRSGASAPLRPYLVLVAGTVLLFVIAFKGRLPASLVFARYFLAFVVLALPFTGFLLARLLDVGGTACDRGFQIEACKNSVRREGFALVILSSPVRVASFEEAFHPASWRVGPYHIFNLRAF